MPDQGSSRQEETQEQRLARLRNIVTGTEIKKSEEEKPQGEAVPATPQQPPQANSNLPAPATPAQVTVVEEPPLLYLAEPSAEYIARPFDRKYDKQAMNASPYLMGAVEAVGKILKLSKTEMYEEMMRDFLVKHQGILEMRPDSVRLQEAKYRKKHNL